MLRMKLACTVLKEALPQLTPFMPASASSLPAKFPSGFLNVEPKEGPTGWCLRLFFGQVMQEREAFFGWHKLADKGGFEDDRIASFPFELTGTVLITHFLIA